jgi:hypothetical protein
MFKFDRKIIKTTGWNCLTCVYKVFNKHLDWRKFTILSLLIIGAPFLILSCSTNKETDVSTTVVTPLAITPTNIAPTVIDQTVSTEETQDEEISSTISSLKDIAREDTLIVAWSLKVLLV